MRKALNSRWEKELVLDYGRLECEQTDKQLSHAEGWLKTHPDDPALLLTAARLAMRNELWGKARQHLIRSLELEPSSVGYDALGQLVERQGEMELAMACFRNALRMNQGRKPEPLPGDPGLLTGPSDV